LTVHLLQLDHELDASVEAECFEEERKARTIVD
jgi:hypothetical protein